MATSTTLADHWANLVGVAMLGTDRRPVPEPPPGPLADLATADDAGGDPPDPPAELARQVALLTAARRGGLRPWPAVPPLEACPGDPRPACPPAAVRRLEELVATWPVLEDEWLDRVTAAGYRLPGDVTVLLLARHRHEPARRAAVVAAAGPQADWLVSLFPELAPARSGRAAGSAPATAPAPAPLPESLAVLLGAPADQAADGVVRALATGVLVARHRPALVRFVAALDAAALAPLVHGLETVPMPVAAQGLAFELADLARLRRAMLDDLADRPPGAVP